MGYRRGRSFSFVRICLCYVLLCVFVRDVLFCLCLCLVLLWCGFGVCVFVVTFLVMF